MRVRQARSPRGIPSKMAVIRAADRAAAANPTSLLAASRPIRDLAPLFEAAKKGDPTAHSVLERLGDDIGKGLAYLVDVLDPQTIVLGGSVGQPAPNSCHTSSARCAVTRSRQSRFAWCSRRSMIKRRSPDRSSWRCIFRCRRTAWLQLLPSRFPSRRGRLVEGSSMGEQAVQRHSGGLCVAGSRRVWGSHHRVERGPLHRRAVWPLGSHQK